MVSAMLTIAAYTFGDALLTVFEVALFVAWLCLLVYVYGDIFRSHDLSGTAKALWVLGIFIFPMLGTLAYLFVRGGQIHERAAMAARHNDEAIRRHMREVGGGQGSSSLDELERLSSLHKQGSLTDDEFQAAKQQLLPSQH
jgi:Phospholipase_D-nuclease N-terminal/Short C-terminal domain